MKHIVNSALFVLCSTASLYPLCNNARNLMTGDLTVCGNVITQTGAIPNASQLGSSFEVDNGANVIPQANTLLISGIQNIYGWDADGIVTHNNGMGYGIFIENRTVLTEYVVDTSNLIGRRGTFNSIQAAINASHLDGDVDIIYIRPGVYTENLTLYHNTYLSGLTIDGRTGPIIIIGNHTLTSDGYASCEKINFQAPTGDSFTIANPIGNIFLLLEFCNIDNSAGVAFRANPAPGASATLAVTSCSITGGTQALVLSGQSTLQASDAQFYTTLPGAPLAELNDVSSIQLVDCTMTSLDDIFAINNSRSAVLTTSIFATASKAYMRFNAPGFFNTTQDSVTSGDPSGNYIVGPGTVQYVNTTVVGPAFGIDPYATQIIQDWQPHSTAGNSTSAIRGTAGFDSTEFTVNNGFVQLLTQPNFFRTYTTLNGAYGATYAVQSTDDFLAVNTSVGALTIELLNAPATLQTFTIKDSTGNAATHNITLTTAGGVVTIDGSTSVTMNTNYESLQVVFNGTSYLIY